MCRFLFGTLYGIQKVPRVLLYYYFCGSFYVVLGDYSKFCASFREDGCLNNCYIRMLFLLLKFYVFVVILWVPLHLMTLHIRIERLSLSFFFIFFIFKAVCGRAKMFHSVFIYKKLDVFKWCDFFAVVWMKKRLQLWMSGVSKSISASLNFKYYNFSSIFLHIHILYLYNYPNQCTGLCLGTNFTKIKICLKDMNFNMIASNS